MKRRFLSLLLVLSLVGLFDATYLTWEHFNYTLPPCSTHWWVDCGKVLTSRYSQWWGMPLAMIGILHYALVFTLSISLFLKWRQKIGWWLKVQTSLGFLFSLYFVGLQLFVIQAICLYCMASALISLILFCTTLFIIGDTRAFFFWLLALLYQGTKKILFSFNPETIHNLTVQLGEKMGRLSFLTRVINKIFNPQYPKLSQKLVGLTFVTPIGLAAGFDYEARLTQSLSCLGFGFQSLGTITHEACVGNPQPRLGRLPQSKSLLVNKGFRNPGAKAVIKKLSPLSFRNPVGISLGQTNTTHLTSQSAVINDILSSFRLFEKSHVRHQYYELNISCPNIKSDFNFYEPKKLDLLLTQIDSLKLKKPVFVKMPISESDETILSLLTIIAQHSPAGVIIGNLQKDRFDPAVVASERRGLGPGNLSGKATFNRSNFLIALTYQKFHSRLIIIGCGGVFKPEDAYLKITLGASLIQMITGLVFQGPQVVAQINQGLSETLSKNKYENLSQIIGSKNNEYLKGHIKK